MRFTVDRLDHVALTCRELEITASWYQRVLGMEREEFGAERHTALKFGGQKVDLHQAGEAAAHARAPVPGGAGLCFVTAVGVEHILDHLRSCGVSPESGPAARTGALGPMTVVCCRDPDGNLVEIGTYLPR